MGKPAETLPYEGILLNKRMAVGQKLIYFFVAKIADE